MAGLLNTVFAFLHYYFDYSKGIWPLSWLGRLRVLPITDEGMSNVVDIIHRMYPHGGEPAFPTEQLCAEISKLNFRGNILSIKDDMYGLNLLQHSIIVNNINLVELVASKTSSFFEIGCNAPIHMAAALGHRDIIQCLVKKRPFDLYKKAGICYPDLHEPVSNYRKMGFMFKDVYRCEEEKMLPIEWAIVGDYLECVKWIFERMEIMGGRRFSLSKCLHFSAQRGAALCLEFFIKQSPKDVDHVSKSGDVPLLEAVVWGRKCARVLIENGADVNKVARNGDTALHRLYRNDIDGIFAIYDTTKYLLTTGIEQLVNTINHRGETALHLLVTHVSYIGGNYYHPEKRSLPRWQIQPDYQEQVIQTLKLLLSFNADPHIYDALHLQPLNKLLHVTRKASSRNDTFECVQGCINSKYIYRNDFGTLAKAISVLIENGAGVNTQCSVGHTPLILLVQTLINTDVVYLVQASDDIIEAVVLLLKNEARCNFISEDQKTCCSLLAELAKKILLNGSEWRHFVQPDSNLGKLYQHQYAELVNKMLITFLEHGLNPNYTTTKKSPHLCGGSGNGLIEFVRITILARNSDDFEMVFMWLRTLLQWGADPDIEPYPSDPIICHSQSSIFLKKQGTQAVSQYIHESRELHTIFENGYAEKLLLLFYNSMDHKVLYESLMTACFMARVHPPGATGQKFIAILNEMAEQPRTLQQMARVAIYKAVGRRLQPSVPQLPLPNVMKKYLLDIE
ncbi:uncharacterized protein LOC128236484 [Mya arenaria]|uniref:uncharacterized protein LOC128236484 n=1 Tax=Mya arenaria TaxID=6604 RepID=UPI0022E2DF66|nr:uncharacterized protein LOC128236484 [Mya arenaria]XP_052807321.1 uncharacterized protein LOC128236484 [Mya arenaria]XP_052807322.1 uncharacterized protein LOC128236484 [Mya arenaria]XP_052807323.1 uncharacterized protein LOC128236484 [Mya arenaria]